MAICAKYKVEDEFQWMDQSDLMESHSLLPISEMVMHSADDLPDSSQRITYCRSRIENMLDR